MVGETSELDAADNNPETAEEITAGLNAGGVLIETTGMLVDVVGDKLDCSVIFFVKFATNYTETNFEKSTKRMRPDARCFYLIYSCIK